MAEPRLTKFLRELTTNLKKRHAFRKNPHVAMRKAGLSKAHQRLIKGRRVAKLSEAVRAEQPEGKEPIVCVMIIDAMQPPHHKFWNMTDEPAGKKKGRSKKTAGTSRRKTGKTPK
jgi:hypothetical protein